MTYFNRCLLTGLLFFFAGLHAYAGSRQLLWQTNAYGDDVHVIDVESRKVIRRLVVGPQPHGIAAPDDASVVYIAIENFKSPTGELIWVDPKTYAITHRMDIGPKPNQLACTPDGRFVYVPCNDGHYWVIDAKEKKVVARIKTGGRPHNTKASRDGKFMFLSPIGPPKRVTIVDVLNGHKVAGEIPYSNSVRPPALAADGKRHYQNVDGLIGFEVSDVARRKVIARVEHRIPEAYTGKSSRCHGLAIRPDQQEIWSCNVEHQTVHVHSLSDDAFPEIAAIPMIGRVYWLCFSPDSKLAFVAVRSEKKVAVVDAQNKQVLGHIEVGDNPKRNLVITVADDS